MSTEEAACPTHTLFLRQKTLPFSLWLEKVNFLPHENTGLRMDGIFFIALYFVFFFNMFLVICLIGVFHLFYRYVFPEFLPKAGEADEFRDRLLDSLIRLDMMRRRLQIDIPEFYVGSILAVCHFNYTTLCSPD